MPSPLSPASASLPAAPCSPSTGNRLNCVWLLFAREMQTCCFVWQMLMTKRLKATGLSAAKRTRQAMRPVRTRCLLLLLLSFSSVPALPALLPLVHAAGRARWRRRECASSAARWHRLFRSARPSSFRAVGAAACQTARQSETKRNVDADDEWTRRTKESNRMR